MAQLGEGLAGELGIKRRDNSKLYQAAWRERNREKNNAYHRDYYHTVIKANPIRLRAKLDSGSYSRRKRKYGLEREQYENLLRTQRGMCIICGEYHGNNLRVDHDHTTGKLRGLLCSKCNAGLGQFRDNPKFLQNAIKYFEAAAF